MAKSSSLQKQLSAAERFATESALHGDTQGAEEASARCASIRRQLVVVAEKQAELGTVGLFPGDVSVLSAEVKARRKRSAVTVGNVTQLPLVSDHNRVSPNYLLRSAVFSVIEKGHRAMLMRERVAAQDGYEVFFSGAQLDQADLDVWLHCLHLSAGKLGEPIEVGLLSFLRSIGRAAGSANQEWLRDSLVRLSMAVIQVKHQGVTVMVPDRMVVYEEKEQISKSTIGLRVSPTMANLFGVARWTALDLGIRAQLIGQPLTQWLHAYLATHAKPLPIALSLLRSLSGSKVAELRMFRRSLKKAADRLVACGFLKSWTVNADDKFVGIRA